MKKSELQDLLGYSVYPKKEREKMKERGLYYPDGSFKPDTQIKREKALAGEHPLLETPLTGERPFEYWSERFRKRQEQWKETSSDEQNHVQISFKGDTIINFIGDTHVGSPNTFYDRLESELTAIINTPNSYVIMVGDLVDGFFWTPAVFEALEPVQEQYAYTDSMLRHLAKSRKLLIGFGGDHDQWPKKMGIDPYYKFSSELHAYYMHGVGFLTAKVDEQVYKLTGAHRLPGHSIRDNTWAAKRASAEIQGSEIYFSGHTHKKGHSLQAIKSFGGEAKKVHFISLGPYKSTDEFSRKHGWAQQSPEEMFGSSIILRADGHKIDYYDDILEANSPESS